MRFEGTGAYVATDDLKVAVNAAIVLERPLLVKGEPGTGKTVLAEEIARGLDAPLLTWNIKSTTKAQQGLYEYDAVSRLRDSQLGEARVHDVRNYLKKGKLWEAFTSPARPVLLIDEIDKADIEFPNDLLREITEYCRQAGLAESTFGKLAVNDGKFVNRLREGGRITTHTLERIRAFIAQHPPTEDSRSRSIFVRQRRQPARGRHLHFFVDGAGVHIQRTTEDEGKAQNIIDLVGVIGAAGGNHCVWTCLFG